MPTLNVPQAQFLQLPHKFRAYVGGFGSGKTWAGTAGMGARFWAYPGVNQGYFAPTYRHIRDIFFPTVEEVAFDLGLRVETRSANAEVDWYEGRRYRGTTICRSMEHPETIVGFKIGHALADEIDLLLKPKAATAWRKIIARLRWKDATNGCDVTTTPEGFRFTHERFIALPGRNPPQRKSYGIVQASTRSNAKNLPTDYIPSLIADYPEALVSAYIDGQFVNLTQGSVYPAFSRKTCLTTARHEPGEVVHIGMDFNVGKMAAVVHVLREGRPLAVAEIMRVLDTPAMIEKIRAQFASNTVFVYPDASGSGRATNNASASDISLLNGAGFVVLADPSNPAVRDRVLAMNKAFEDGYKVNPDTCPTYVEALEQQAYNEHGEPDKSTGFDHPNDAGGYFIAHRFPIPSRKIERIRIGGA